MNQNTLELIIQLQGQAEQQLAAMQSQLHGLQGSFDSAAQGSGVFGSIISGAAGVAGGALINLASSGFGAVTSAIADGIAGAREAAQLFAQTTAVITSTGGAAGVSAQHVVDYATALSAASGASLFGDDQIQQSENLLLTFTNIKGATLDAATAMSVDLAQAMGGAPKDSAIQLGKALNDPIKGITALTRIGVTFTDEQKDQIRTMQEAGDMAGAQGVILAELNKEFGGSAAAAAAADGGIAQFRDRLGEAAETLGGALLPLFGLMGSLLNTTIAPALEYVVGAIAGFIQGITSASDPFQTLIGVINSVIPGFSIFVSFIQANVTPILVGIGTAIAVAVIPALLSAALAIGGLILSFGLLLAPLIAVAAAAALLYQAWVTNFGGIQQIVQPIIDAVIAGFSAGGIGGAISGLITSLNVAGPQLLAWFSTTATMILAQLSTWAQAFIGWIAPMIPPMLLALGNIIVSIGQWAVAQVPGIIAQLLAWGQALVGWIAPQIPFFLAALGALASSFLGWIGQQTAPLIAQFNTWAAGMIVWIPGAIASFLAQWPGMLSGFLDWIGAAAGPILTQLGQWALQFIAWIGPALPGIIAGLAGISLAIIAFVAETAVTIAAKLLTWAVAFIGWILSDVVPKIPGALAAVAAAIFTFIATTVSEVTPKLAALAAAFVVWIATDVIPKIPGELAAINAAIGDWVSGAAGWVADQVASIGKSIIDGIAKGISNSVDSLVSAAVNAVNSALNAAKRAIGFGSPAAAFMPLGDSIPEGIVVGITRSSPKAVGAMVDLASKLVSLISSGVEAFAKLRDIAAVPQSSIQLFADSIRNTLVTFGHVVIDWDRSMMSSASQFAAKAGQAIELLSKGVAFLVSLQDFRALPAETFHLFAQSLDIALREIVDISTRQMLIGLANAQQFAESSAKIIGLISTGVDAFKKLLDFVAPAEDRFHQFALAITNAVGWISHVAAWFQAGAASSAAAFADNANRVVGVIGTGTDAFAKLKDFVAPTAAVFQLFALALTNAVGWITHIAGWFRGYAVEQAAAFAQSAGTIVGIISGAVDAFIKLKDFQGVPTAAMIAFTAALLITVQKIAWLSTQWSPQAVASAATFAENAARVVGVIVAGVEGFIKLADFQGVPGAAISAFTLALSQTVQQIAWLSTQWAPTVVAAAAVFAQNAGQAVGLIGTGVEAFVRLADFEGVPGEALIAFTQSMLNVIQQMAWLSLQWSPAMIAQASAFANSIQNVIGMISGAIETFGHLADFHNTSAGVLTAFTQGLIALLAEMQRLVLPASTNIGINIMQGMINGIVSGRSALVQTMINVVMSAVYAAKAALGIASESSLFRDQIAGNIGAGLVSGMLAQVAAVQSAGQSLANAATQAPRAAPVTAASAGVQIASNRSATSNQQPAQHVYDFSGMILNPQPGQNGRTLARQFHGEVRRLIEEDTRRRP